MFSGRVPTRTDPATLRSRVHAFSDRVVDTLNDALKNQSRRRFAAVMSDFPAMTKASKHLSLSVYLEACRRSKGAIAFVAFMLGAFFYLSTVLPGQVVRHQDAEPRKKAIGTVVWVAQTSSEFGGQQQSIRVSIPEGYVGGDSTLPVKIGDVVTVEYTVFDGKPERMARVFLGDEPSGGESSCGIASSSVAACLRTEK
jgi:hypothetical protein